MERAAWEQLFDSIAQWAAYRQQIDVIRSGHKTVPEQFADALKKREQG